VVRLPRTLPPPNAVAEPINVAPFLLLVGAPEAEVGDSKFQYAQSSVPMLVRLNVVSPVKSALTTPVTVAAFTEGTTAQAAINAEKTKGYLTQLRIISTRG
jgi:hypothetical protein